jgi:hypothetical protein
MIYNPIKADPAASFIVKTRFGNDDDFDHEEWKSSRRQDNTGK